MVPNELRICSILNLDHKSLCIKVLLVRISDSPVKRSIGSNIWGPFSNWQPKMAEQFWQQTFASLETSSYPVLPAVGYQSSITKIIGHEIDRIDCATL